MATEKKPAVAKKLTVDEKTLASFTAAVAKVKEATKAAKKDTSVNPAEFVSALGELVAKKWPKILEASGIKDEPVAKKPAKAEKKPAKAEKKAPKATKKVAKKPAAKKAPKAKAE